MENFNGRILSLIEEEMFYSKEDCDWIISKIKNKGNKIILDVGCGKIHPFYLSDKLKNFEIIGIDKDEKIIKSNIKFLKSSNLKNLTFRLADINNIKYDEKFNYIISSRVLPFIRNKKKLFTKYFQLLEDNGKLIITDYIKEKNNFRTFWNFVWNCLLYVKKKRLINIAKQNKFHLIEATSLGCSCGKEYPVWGFVFEKEIQRESI